MVVAGSHLDHPLALKGGSGIKGGRNDPGIGGPLVDRTLSVYGHTARRSVSGNVHNIDERSAIALLDLHRIAAAGGAPGPDSAVSLQSHREVGRARNLGGCDHGSPASGLVHKLLLHGDGLPAG